MWVNSQLFPHVALIFFNLLPWMIVAMPTTGAFVHARPPSRKLQQWREGVNSVSSTRWARTSRDFPRGITRLLFKRTHDHDYTNYNYPSYVPDHFRFFEFSTKEVIHRPSIPHARLPNKGWKAIPDAKNILVVGDVHGCLDELKELHTKAIQENDGRSFQFVILVGDMCNKGPQSAEVIQYVRKSPRWYSVRGNHEEAALIASLGRTERRPTRKTRKKFQWMSTLSLDDVEWLSELPYSITIPGWFLGKDETDTVIVHAGLMPDRKLSRQACRDMMLLRNYVPSTELSNKAGTVKPFKRASRLLVDSAVPWATRWKGPQRVIFGHDAQRGLQRYGGDWAIGLDTGAVYGNEMTAIILPERKLVSINVTTAHFKPRSNVP